MVLAGTLPSRLLAALVSIPVAVSVLAPTPVAQVSEKAVVKLFGTALKGVAAEFKQASGDAAATALEHIAAITAALSGGADVDRELGVLFGDLVAFQVAMQTALDFAELAMATAGADALEALQAGPPALDGQYPSALYAGAGGSEAKTRAGLAKQQAKLMSKVGKALAKLAKALEKSRGVGLSFALEPVQPSAHLTFGEMGVIDGGVTDGLVTIDVVMGWSDLDVLGDVQLCMAGTGGSVVVTWACQFGCTVGKPVVGEDQRWQWCAPIFEGNYVLAVADDPGDDGGDPGPTLSIGFR